MGKRANTWSIDALRRKWANANPGTRVNAKVPKAERRAAVLRATSRVKTTTPVNVAKLLRG